MTAPIDPPRAQPPLWGEPAPWFTAPTRSNPQFVFSSLGGRFVLLCFLPEDPPPALLTILRGLGRGEDEQMVRFGVWSGASLPDDPTLAGAFPLERLFLDADGAIRKAWGLPPGLLAWFLIDPMLRIAAAGTAETVAQLPERIAALPPAALHALTPLAAPVMTIPRVLEPELCKALIAEYQSGEPMTSGFMRTVDGRTVLKTDSGFKRRQDVDIRTPALVEALRDRVRRILVPMIARAFQFHVTRIERYIVACYDAESGGFFRPHRDNTTAGTAHRRFAVSINLNSEFEGGALRFPEFGPQTYRPPAGGATVFSCSLLHEATPVTAGTRYATLPFLYDDAAAKIRERNNALLDKGIGRYQSGISDPPAA